MRPTARGGPCECAMRARRRVHGHLSPTRPQAACWTIEGEGTAPHLVTGREDLKSSRKPREPAHNVSRKDWMDSRSYVASYVAGDVAVG